MRCFAVLTVFFLVQDFVLSTTFSNLVHLDINTTSYYLYDAFACIVLTMIFGTMLVRYASSHPDVLHFPEHPGRSLLICLIIALGVSGITLLWLNFAYQSLAPNVSVLEESIESYSESWSGIESEPYLPVFLSVVFFGPIVEELMFRGLIFNYLKETGHVFFAIIVSGLLFGIWHMELIQVSYTIFVGIVLALVYEYTGSLFEPMIIHMIYNFSSTLPPGWEFLDDTILEGELLFLVPAVILILIMVVQIIKRKRRTAASI